MFGGGLGPKVDSEGNSNAGCGKQLAGRRCTVVEEALFVFELTGLDSCSPLPLPLESSIWGAGHRSASRLWPRNFKPEGRHALSHQFLLTSPERLSYPQNPLAWRFVNHTLSTSSTRRTAKKKKKIEKEGQLKNSFSGTMAEAIR
jgi:hypothetical protein